MKTVWPFETPIIATFLSGIVFKPSASVNLQATFCANTQRIFGILSMNHISQHAFEVARSEECCNTVSGKQIEINASKTQKRRPMLEMPGFLSGGVTILICVEASMLAALIRKMIQLCMFANSIWRNVLVTV